MNRKNYYVLFSLLAVSLAVALAASLASPLFAQDESPAEDESISSIEPDEAVEELDQVEIPEGITHGVYYWADPDPAAIQAFLDFGIDTVSIRIGTPVLMNRSPEGDAIFSWQDDIDFGQYTNLPQSLKYRFVVEIDPEFIERYEQGNFIAWLINDLTRNLGEIPENLTSVEIRFTEISDPEVVMSLMEDASYHAVDFDIELGFNEIYISELPEGWFEQMASHVDGFVVYFINTDFAGPRPKITDRSWIDYTIGELELFEIPYTAVLPVFNKAILFPIDSPGEAVEIPPFDLEGMGMFGDAEQRGAAGIEFTMGEDLNIGGFNFYEGDTIRILKSLEEIELKKAIEEIPLTTQYLREIALFRFPLVPGFDPSANQALTDAGWLASSSEGLFDQLEAEKEGLDQKQGKGSQIIMMITLGLMMFLIMRMMSKGKGDAAGSKGGDGGK